MSTLIALLLAVCLLTVCAGTPVEGEMQAISPPTLSAVTGAPAETFSYQVEIEDREGTVSAPDGTPLVHYSFQVPELTALRADGTCIQTAEGQAEAAALALAETFNSQFADWSTDGDVSELAAAAEEELAMRRAAGQDWPGAYELEFQCDVYQTDQLISVSGGYSSDTGGSHPNLWLLAWNFDLRDGTFLTPEHLALDSEAFLEGVCDELVRQCHQRAEHPEEFFWSDFQQIVGDWSSYAVSFDEGGMTVAFSPYELACYAAGPQVFELSYEQLRPYLSEDGLALLGLSAEAAAR